MNSNLTPEQQFFYENAGFSYQPGEETQEEGRRRCAVRYAAAEQEAAGRGFTFEWTLRHEIYHVDDTEPGTCEDCVMFDEVGNVIGSLACIDDATDGYRRVVEAELADEYFRLQNIK